MLEYSEEKKHFHDLCIIFFFFFETLHNEKGIKIQSSGEEANERFDLFECCKGLTGDWR